MIVLGDRALGSLGHEGGVLVNRIKDFTEDTFCGCLLHYFPPHEGTMGGHLYVNEEPNLYSAPNLLALGLSGLQKDEKCFLLFRSRPASGVLC